MAEMIYFRDAAVSIGMKPEDVAAMGDKEVWENLMGYQAMEREAYAHFESEANARYQREMDNQRWLEENGPEGHGWH